MIGLTGIWPSVCHHPNVGLQHLSPQVVGPFKEAGLDHRCCICHVDFAWDYLFSCLGGRRLLYRFVHLRRRRRRRRRETDRP